MADLRVHGDAVEAAFDPRDGRLVELSARASGWRIVSRAQAGLSFGLLVPRPGRRATFVRGEGQPCARVEATADGGSVTLVWEQPTDDRGDRVDLTFRGRVSAADGGLLFEAEIDNRGDRTVEAVAWPCIGAIAPSAPGRALTRRHPARTTFADASLHPLFTENQGYWGTLHPAEAEASTVSSLFILIEEEGQGLYVGCHNPTGAAFVRWFFQQKPGYADTWDRRAPAGGAGSLELLVQHFPFLRPGGRAALSPIQVASYAGSWQDGVEHYRRWRSTWFRPPRRPSWIEDIHSWLQIQIYGSEDAVNFRYADLPSIARECREHGIGAIQLTGWAWGGQDRGNPSHDTDPALGTREELAEAIRACEALGVHVILFCKWTWIEQGHPRYGELVRHTAKNQLGSPYPAHDYRYYTWTQLAGIGTRPLIPTCTASPAWREEAAAELRKVVSLGSSGLLFDEAQHHGQALFCFDPSHEHPQPAYLYAYDCALARKLKEAAGQDFLFAGELCYDVEMTEYHMLYTRFARGHVPVARTIDPWMPIMMAAPGFDDRNKINKCLEYRYIISYEPFNFKGRPRDAPLTLAYGRLVDDLRRRYRGFLWDGDFLGARGAAVTVDGAPSDAYSVHVDRGTGRRAAVVCNTDFDAAAVVTVSLEAGRLFAASPEAPDPRPVDGPLSVPPRSVVVVGELE